MQISPEGQQEASASDHCSPSDWRCFDKARRHGVPVADNQQSTPNIGSMFS